MERHHGLDLGLYPSDTSGSSDVCDQNFSGDDDPSSIVNQQERTLSYNGRAFSFDLMELQARAIILLASRGVGGAASNKSQRFEAAAMPLKEGNRLYIPQRLSIKKSLQSFLHDRKRRAKAASPYGR